MITDLPEPCADESQVLIDVYASTVVFPDLLQTRGLYQLTPEPPYIPGGVAAGTVRDATGTFAAGERVVALTGLGAWAETAVAAARTTLPLPDNMSFPAAAAMLFNYGTMYFALLRRGGLSAADTVLVHGAAGGIGTATLDLSRRLGARTIAVVSSPQKAEIARAAGATDVITAHDFKDAVLSLTDGRGVNMVVDPVGGDRFTDSLRCLSPEGRLLVIGFAGGPIPVVKANRLLLNNISVVGVGWGAFWTAHPNYLRQEWTDLLTVLAGAEPVIGHTYPLADAATALRSIDDRQATGNIVLSVR